MENSIRIIFHLGAATNFAYGIYYDLLELKVPDDYAKISIDFAGRWKYLTFWNMVILLAYYGCFSCTVSQYLTQYLSQLVFILVSLGAPTFLLFLFYLEWSVGQQFHKPKGTNCFAKSEGLSFWIFGLPLRNGINMHKNGITFSISKLMLFFQTSLLQPPFGCCGL